MRNNERGIELLEEGAKLIKLYYFMDGLDQADQEILKEEVEEFYETVKELKQIIKKT